LLDKYKEDLSDPTTQYPKTSTVNMVFIACSAGFLNNFHYSFNVTVNATAANQNKAEAFQASET
jgi:hypothetical protein